MPKSQDLDLITAAEWLRVRNAVASRIGSAATRMEQNTRVRIAEELLSVSFIDVPTVLAYVKPAPALEDTTVVEEASA